MKCMKHSYAEATRALDLDGDRYYLCADCSWRALLDGHTLTCLSDGAKVHLDENEKPIFDRGRAVGGFVASGERR